MLSVDAAFDRIGSVLRERSYELTKDQKTSDGSGDRLAEFNSPNMSVRVRWTGRARRVTIQIKVDAEWVDLAKEEFGPDGLEDTAVDALVRAVRNEVDETSTGPG